MLAEIFPSIFGWGLILVFSGLIFYWIYCVAANAPVWRSAIPGGIIGFFVGIMEWNILSILINTFIAYIMALAVSFVVQKLIGGGSSGGGDSGGGDSGGGGSGASW